MIRPSDMDIILESRRNPDLNTKQSIMEFLLGYIDNPNIYVSFADIPKIGINPKSDWTYMSRIQGIWAYPFMDIYKYFAEKTAGKKNHMFATYRKYMYILEKQDGFNHINSKNYSKKDYIRDTNYLINEFKANPEWIKYAVEGSHNNLEKTIMVIKYIGNRTNHGFNAMKVSSIIMNDLGYDSLEFVDNGLHCDIKNEICFINPRSYKVVDMFNMPKNLINENGDYDVVKILQQWKKKLG